jgi:peptidoglycan/LPS O-acetylase OafA/YrhL
MRMVAWFQIIVGMAVAALWVVLLATGQVPEVTAGRVDIWFHIAAESAMALLLLTAGVAALRRVAVARLLSSLALGLLLYSAVSSPGYYAERGDWLVVAAFAVVVAAAAACVAAVVRAVPPGPATVPPGQGTARLATTSTRGSS